MPAVAWPHVLQWCSCHWVEEDRMAKDGAGPPSSSSCPCSSHCCLHGSNHNLTSSFSFPPAASQTWPPGLMRSKWRLAWHEEGEGQAAPDTDCRGRRCIAVWGWTIPNPRSSCWLLKSDSFLLKKVSNVQHCSNYSDRNLVKQKWWEKPGGMRPEGGTNSLHLLSKAWLAASPLGPGKKCSKCIWTILPGFTYRNRLLEGFTQAEETYFISLIIPIFVANCHRTCSIKYRGTPLKVPHSNECPPELVAFLCARNPLAVEGIKLQWA